MNFPRYVEKKKKEMRKENIQKARTDIAEAWIQEKIGNYLQNNPGLFTKEEVENNILNNDIVVSFFCKDPAKQNTSEKLCAEILGLTKLPASGKKCVRFNDNGDIVSSSSGNTKSADFFIDGAYATQKYTLSFGGAND